MNPRASVFLELRKDFLPFILELFENGSVVNRWEPEKPSRYVLEASRVYTGRVIPFQTISNKLDRLSEEIHQRCLHWSADGVEISDNIRETTLEHTHAGPDTVALTVAFVFEIQDDKH